MATDWASDVKKYVPDADDGVIAGIVRYCGIALQKVDSSLVAFSDPTEIARVRNNFLKKKCGLTDPDTVLDSAIAAVGARMEADRTKNRVTVYYLLSEHFGLHHLFVKAPKAAAAKATKTTNASSAAPAVAAAAVGAIAASAVTAAAAPKSAPKVAAALASVAPVSSPTITAGAAAGSAAVVAYGLEPLQRPIGSSGVWALLSDGGARTSGLKYIWVALALAALIPIVLPFIPRFDTVPVAAVAVAPAAAPVAAPAAVAPVVAPVPEGAGIVAETRDEKPVVKVYFATGKAEIAPEFAAEAAGLKAYLDAHPGSSLGVSGYNDASGNAAVNAALSKKRAQAVQAALVAASIPETAIELIKPEVTTDTQVTDNEARRVEVFIK